MKRFAFLPLLSACIIHEYQPPPRTERPQAAPTSLTMVGNLNPSDAVEAQTLPRGAAAGYAFSARAGSQVQFRLDRLVAGMEVFVYGPMREGASAAEVSVLGQGDGPHGIAAEGTYVAAVAAPTPNVRYRLELLCIGGEDCRATCDNDERTCPSGSGCFIASCAGEPCPSYCVPFLDSQEAQPTPEEPVPVETAGPLCGTRGAAECAEGTYCDFPEDAACGESDRPGSCREVPSLCTREYMPVCGCDGQTYPNACAARANEVSVRASGACASP